MKTVIICAFLTLCYLGVFYIWGSAFLKLIHSRIYISECISFGFIVMHAVYQFFYLPFFLLRGSYRSLTILWIVVSSGITVCYLVYNAVKHKKRKKGKKSISLVLLGLFAVVLIIFLCLLVGLHQRPYQADGYYIYYMDRMVYQDIIFHNDGALNFHRGFNSFFALFGTASVITGVRPFYIALFTMRFLGVIMTSLSVYRIGKVVFDYRRRGISGYAVALSMIVPFAMMFWWSMYTGHFFYMRTNESKAYCQLFLLPLAFSVCVEMFLLDGQRDVVWKKLLAIGFGAIPVAASALTSYPMLIIISTVAVLVYDHFQNAKSTVLRSLMCIVPNIVYTIVILLN